MTGADRFHFTGRPGIRIGWLRFVLNTLAHPVGPGTLPAGRSKLALPLPLHLFRTPGLGEVLVQGLDAFKPVMFRVAIENRESSGAQARAAYRAPHCRWADRAAMLAFARQVPTGPGGPVNQLNKRDLLPPLRREAGANHLG